jgi:hypothetical protein
LTHLTTYGSIFFVRQEVTVEAQGQRPKSPANGHRRGVRAPALQAVLAGIFPAALQNCLFLRVLSLFEANQHKFISMNTLHAKTRFSNRAQSCLIKPNQGVFLNQSAHHSFTPILHHSTRVLAFRRSKPAPPFSVDFSCFHLISPHFTCFQLNTPGGAWLACAPAVLRALHPNLNLNLNPSRGFLAPRLAGAAMTGA